MPDISRLSLEQRLKHTSHFSARQNEADEAVVFSTADTSVQGTGRDARHNNLHMGSQSSMSHLEETKSRGRGNLTRREQQLNQEMIAKEMVPPELGRPSLSESTGPPSKNFSPKFDKMSNRTGQEDLLDENVSEEAPCNTLNTSGKTYHGGGRARYKPA